MLYNVSAGFGFVLKKNCFNFFVASCPTAGGIDICMCDCLQFVCSHSHLYSHQVMCAKDKHKHTHTPSRTPKQIDKHTQTHTYIHNSPHTD